MTVVGAYGAGAILGSASLGLVAGWLGEAVVEPGRSERLALPVLALILAAADLGLLRLRTPSVGRQTQRLWWYRLRKPVAAFAWGFDLGLVVTSIRVSSLGWVALAAAFLAGSGWWGAVVMAPYGVGLVTNLVAATLAESRRISPSAAVEDVGTEFGVRFLALQPMLRRLSGLSLLTWGAASALLLALAN